MTYSEFIITLNDLKNDAEDAKEDYLNCLDEQKKAKKIWAISKSKIKDFKDQYNVNNLEQTINQINKEK